MDYGEAVTEFEEFFTERYEEEVLQAEKRGDESIVVEFKELDLFSPEVTEYIRDNPEQALDAAREGVMAIDLLETDMNVRFVNMPEEDYVLLRNMRSEHIGRFVPVEGMIKRASQVKPEVVSATFECTQCGATYEKDQDSSQLKSPYKCDCGSKRFEPLEKHMRDTQIVTLEENPESREGSEQPSSLSVILEGDLVDPEFQKKVVPGNVVEVTGIVRERPIKKNSKKFDIFMEANNVEPRQQEFEQLELDEDEIEHIKEMAEDPKIFERIIGSIAPSIYGHDKIKEAIALQLFGGVRKTREDGVKSRGDLHILLIGEPGTGKSQLLKFTGELAPKGRYVVGKSSTGAGLCVTGDTLIHTENGFEEIGSVVGKDIDYSVKQETAIEYSDSLYSFSDGGIELNSGSSKWRMPKKPCIKLETSFGKNIEASENTDILVAGKKGVEWKKIAEIEKGDYVAAPNYTDIDRGDPDIMDYFDFEKEKLKISEDSVELVRSKMKGMYGSLRNAAHEMELSESFVYTSLKERFIPFKRLELILNDLGIAFEEIDVERAMLRNGSDFKIPENFDSDLMYLTGLIFGDGDISIYEDRGQVRISNSEERTLEKAQGIIQEKFDKKIAIERQEDKVPVLRLSLKTVAKFFQNIGMQSPKESLKLETRLTTSKNADSFLRGLMDADGSVVDRDGGSDSVQMSTISPELGKQVQLMLETFGIKAKKRERDRRGTYEREDGHKIESKSVQTHLVIRGENIDNYQEEIGFSIGHKESSLKRITGKTRNSNNDSVPINQVLKNSEAKTGEHWTYFNQEKNPGEDRVKQIIQDIDLEQEVEEKVEEINSESLKWEKVTKTEKTGKKELYDLTVEDSHNFIGNGIITHNTASVVKEESTGEFSLEAGAVVLAHKGMAAIDEIDKMSVEDRSSLHEAMEQQQISVSKANIQATLNAQTSILAAGNPKLGRFDPYEPIPEQINIGDTLLSRFDFIFPVKDEPDKDRDTKLANQILSNHREPEEQDADIDKQQLRRYVAYAKKNVRPQLLEEATDKIQEFYVSMRSSGDKDSVPITARQLEAMVRIAEASARAQLKEEVDESDAQRAIDILTYTLEQVGMDPETGDFDIDRIESGVSSSQRNRIQTIKHLIDELSGDDNSAEIEEVIERAESEDITPEKTEKVIEKLKREGELFEPKQGFVQKI